MAYRTQDRIAPNLAKIIVAQGTVQAWQPFRDHFDSDQSGGARRPDKNEIKRLRDAAKYYNARDVVLAEWVKGHQFKFNWLVNIVAIRRKRGERSIQEYCFADGTSSLP